MVKVSAKLSGQDHVWQFETEQEARDNAAQLQADPAWDSVTVTVDSPEDAAAKAAPAAPAKPATPATAPTPAAAPAKA